jgi:tetratricopeptide (TPR) repeat protein
VKTNENDELPIKVHNKIKRLCEQGDRCLELDEYNKALDKYREAWGLIPENKIDWEASTWVLSSAGEVYFRQGQFDEALNRYLRAVQCPSGLGNPYIHLRIGQLHYELGQLDVAADELTRAFMGAGDDIFDDEDPKYFQFVRSKLRPSESE